MSVHVNPYTYRHRTRPALFDYLRRRRYTIAQLRRLASPRVDYMELEPGEFERDGFSCATCVFFQKAYCVNCYVRAPVRASGCCNQWSPTPKVKRTFRATDELKEAKS